MFGNIYLNKNYRLLAVVPIALLLISLFFIPHIPLDSSLRGGINVQLQTSTNMSSSAITSALDAKIPGAQASVAAAPGGISITIAANASLAQAQLELLGIYGAYSNYSAAGTRIAVYQNELVNQSGNTTLEAALGAEQANLTSALNSESTQLASMLTLTKPIVNGQRFPYNSTDAQGMLNAAKAAYSNASSDYKNYVMAAIQGIVPFSSYTYQEVTPTLGSYFLSQMQGIIIASFIIVAIAVFIIFKTPIPAFAIVFGAGNDILVALGAMGAFGIPLGVASIGGLLMLIGYSIDTDMLATIRIIKRGEGTPAERAFSTMKTGMTMTFAAILTFSVLLVVSYLTFIPTYFEISSVVLFGLIADLFTTWFGNTTMVLWYKQKKEAKMQ